MANCLCRALTGVPIAGEILHRCEEKYWGLITFAGCAYAAGLGCFGVVMWLQKRRTEKKIQGQGVEMATV